MINTNLKEHTESVHEKETVKCDICHSNSTAKRSLKRHIELVLVGKTFKCDVYQPSVT